MKNKLDELEKTIKAVFTSYANSKVGEWDVLEEEFLADAEDALEELMEIAWRYEDLKQ